MTRKSKYLHKLGNALRAFKGGEVIMPHKMAKQRAIRWLNRCADAGYIHPRLWKLTTT